MPELLNLLRLYVPLVGWIGLGMILGRTVPSIIPNYLGKFLFWIGVPIGIAIFLRQTDLSASIWLAPIVAWIAVGLGAGFAWFWIKAYPWFYRKLQTQALLGLQSDSTEIGQQIQQQIRQQIQQWMARPLQKPGQGSFLLAAMVGNTGYLGYPITLALAGSQHFGWAIFYDTLGSTLAAYGVGVVLAAYFGTKTQVQVQALLSALVKNPALWSFWIGLGIRNVPLPQAVEQGLTGGAWVVIGLSLLLLGMRLGRLQTWHHVQPAVMSLAIKMLLVPLLIGYLLRSMGVEGAPLLVLVLQAGMPPAFATLVIAEAYDLDRDLTVATLAIGCVLLLLLLPVWLWLFT